MKKKNIYWICVDPGSLLDLKNPSMLKRAMQEVEIGAVMMTTKNREPKIYSTEVWKEITEELYEERLAHPDDVFCYDGIHCIGDCTDCRHFGGYHKSPILGRGRVQYLNIRQCLCDDLLYKWNEKSHPDGVLYSCCVKRDED